MADVWDFGPEDPIDNSVLLRLASHCNDQGKQCFPSIEEVAKKVRRSERTVSRSIAQLEIDGWITVERGVGKGNVSQYVVNVALLKRRQADAFREEERGQPRQEKVTADPRKGDSGDNPPYPLLGRNVKETSEETSGDPGTEETRILCDVLGIFNMKEQADMHKCYAAFIRISKKSPESAREHMWARWEEYKKKPYLEWRFGSAYKFFMSGVWNEPAAWPQAKGSEKKDPFANMKFINSGGKK